MPVRDLTAIVTGAASKRGIGRATVHTLAAAGWNIAVLDLDEANAKEAADEVAERAGVQAFGVRCDVTDEASVESALAALDVSAPPVGALVNNAGITSPTPFLEVTGAEWDRIFAVNVRGAFNITRRAAPGMVERGFGRIVFLSSVSAVRGGGVFGGAAYSAPRTPSSGSPAPSPARSARTASPSTASPPDSSTPTSPAARSRASGRHNSSPASRSGATATSPTSPTSSPTSAERSPATSPASPTTSTAARTSPENSPPRRTRLRGARVPKLVYDFSEGGRDMKDLLGGKGANLAEMTGLGLPVPPAPSPRRRTGTAATCCPSCLPRCRSTCRPSRPDGQADG